MLGAHTYQDQNRVGFDCSGLAEYSAWQATHNGAGPGVDIGAGTGSQVGSSAMAPVAAGAPLKPGDFVYYGSGGAHHVGIYVAPGVIINAPESGLPVQVQTRATTPGIDPNSGDPIRVRRLP